MKSIAKTKHAISLVEQINEVRREIELRERLYPQWVSVGTITATDAEERFNRICAVLETLMRVKKGETVIEP